MRYFILVLLLSWGVSLTSRACELCAVYGANNARADAGHGFLFTLSEQYIPFETVQLDGRELPSSILDDAFLHSSMLHFVPTWNFSEKGGVSLNVPVGYKRFKRFYLSSTGFESESGHEFGLSDISLVGRYALWKRMEMEYSVAINLLAGVKFPTGDASRVREEVESTRELDEIYGVGHQHAVSGVHLRDLALGSGSFDGLFGVTLNSRIKRWFFNAQVQYYLRTSGEAGYEFGDSVMVGGGPGAYLLLRDNFTLSLQANAAFDQTDPDMVLGRQNRNTGMTAWYVGPEFTFTWGEHFSGNLGVDIPVAIDNRGLQNVPDLRVHGGITWRF